MIRALYLAFGGLSLALALAGTVLPLHPTVPFLLLACACFARGDERLHRWLQAHPKLGPRLRAWQERREVPLRAKLLASAMLVGSVAVAWFTGVPLTGLVLLAVVAVGVLAFLLSCPSASPAVVVDGGIDPTDD